MESYKTITKPSEGLYKEKGSKFISFAYPVENEEQISELVGAIKKEFYDARHHCYAWRLGLGGERTRAVDDGEPSSTAGKPILGQILSNELTNILIVVVRYFGGTKLGVSGLIKAYKDAAADAISETEIVERAIEKRLKLTFGYETTSSVMKVVKNHSPRIVSQSFDNLSTLELSVEKRIYDQFFKQVSDISGVIVDEIED